MILGTVQMGLPYGINNINGKPSLKECHEILKEAYQSEIRYLDTAEAYGTAHKMIGDFHRENPQNLFNIITKIPAGTNISDINNKVEQYLQMLHVSQLYSLMFHSFSSYVENKEKMPLIVQMKEQNKISHIGISVYSNTEFEKAIQDKDINLIQLPFNLLDNDLLRGRLIAEAKKENKIIHTRSTFLQGLFFKDTADTQPVVIALREQLLQIKSIADEYGISIAALALGYCLYQKNIDNVLIGVDSIAQLKADVCARNYKISEEIIKKVNDMPLVDIDLINTSLWN